MNLIRLISLMLTIMLSIQLNALHAADQNIVLYNEGNGTVSVDVHCAIGSSADCPCNKTYSVMNIPAGQSRDLPIDGALCGIQSIDFFNAAAFSSDHKAADIGGHTVLSTYGKPQGGKTLFIKLKQKSATVWYALPSYTAYVAKQGDYLMHNTTPQGTIKFVNNDESTPVFVTSDQGLGLQAEVPAQAIFLSRLGVKPDSLIECQKPYGNPVSCVEGCQSDKECAYPVLSTQFNVQTKNYNVSSFTSDFLNEQHSLRPDYVFLDTIINNTDVIFDMAITTAPLYQTMIDPTTKLVTSAAGTLAAALSSGNNGAGAPFSFINSIYSLTSQPESQRTITLGNNTYPVTFLSFGSNSLVDGPVNPDDRYTLYGKNQNDPQANRLSTKRHMAYPPQTTDLYPSLALGRNANVGYQTIILYPRNPTTTCQPVIFVGRDSMTNTFYALTYLLAFEYTTPTGEQIQCCQVSGGTVCQNDTLYCPTNEQTASGCLTVSANSDALIQSGQAARLRLVIDPILDPNSSKPTSYGWASRLDALPGLWWPGQPDFTVMPMVKKSSTLTSDTTTAQPPPSKIQ